MPSRPRWRSPGARPARTSGFARKAMPEAGQLQHRQIVGAVAHRNHLLHAEPLGARDLAEVVRLALTVDDLGAHLAGDHAVDDVELVGVEVIDAQPPLQLTAHEGESAGEDRGPVAEAAERGDQPFGAVHQRRRFDDAAAAPTRAALRSSADAAAEALLEIELAAHRRLGDRAPPPRPRRRAAPARRSPRPGSAWNPCRRRPAADCGDRRCRAGTRCRRRTRWVSARSAVRMSSSLRIRPDAASSTQTRPGPVSSSGARLERRSMRSMFRSGLGDDAAHRLEVRRRSATGRAPRRRSGPCSAPAPSRRTRPR